MSMNQELEKICNIAGYPIYPWAADQLKIRSENGSLETRNDDNLLYLANKGAWVRIVSSVNLESNLMEYFNKNLSLGIDTQRRLAENYVLYGGTSTYSFQSQQIIGSLNENTMTLDQYEGGDLYNPKNSRMNLRSGIDPNGAYNMFGQKELSDYGYRPMPGITSVTIESTGRMGSLRQATVNFKVWDKYQLDVMDALYFRPGFTVLIEYGHAKYYDNQGRLQSSEHFMLDPFLAKLTKEDINLKLSTNIRKSYGNYGGMLGIVTSFNFSMTQEGGYDCTIKAMSLGAVMGNYPINHTSTLSNIYYRQLKMYLDSERNEAEIKARDEAQSNQDAEIKKAEDALNSSKGAWAKLKIDDPFKNLLFNTKNIKIYKGSDKLNFDLEIATAARAIKDARTEKEVEDAQIKYNQLILNSTPPANDEVVTQSTIDYKLTHDISDSKTIDFSKQELTTDPETFINKYYYIESQDGINDGPAVYYNEDSHYIQANPNITVKFDVNKLNSIFLDRGAQGINIVQPPVGNLTLGLTPKYDGNTAFDIIENLRGFSAYPIAYQYGQSGLQFLGDSAKQAAFTIAYYYNDDRNKALGVFNNPNSTYRVEYIKSINKTSKDKKYLINIKLQSTENSDYYIELGADPFSGGAVSDNYYYTSDLSLISYASGNQDLMTNKPYENYKNAVLEAEKRAAEITGKNAEKIANDYNTEQLKATTDSESTLELMLRSILLFGINNLEGKNIDYSTFIKDLFSEGAYSAIFSGDIPGKPDYSKYNPAFFQKYIDGSLTPSERLDTNFRYGNNFYLMSGENAYKNDSNGAFALKNQLRDESYFSLTQQANTFVPQVNFEELFKIVPITYGESSDLEVNKKPQLSVFINLGLFFLMLNHTGILYNADTQKTIERGDVITPMTYIDFNPETNFYLSSINQISIDPYKFLVPYNGTAQDYLKMFDADLVKDGKSIKATSPQKDQNSTADPIQPTPLFNFDNDRLSGNLPQQKKAMDGKSNGYVGKLMYVMVDVNYLLEVIKNLKNGSDTNEVYFQTTIEQILTDLNKSMGNYNAFRLSYNDSSNCFVITDDQIQSKPDSQAGSVHSEMIKDFTTFEIPIYGKKSIARAFELRTDISSRLASMIAIASNPGATSNQVKTAKNTSDFGVYNTGSFDRYIPMKTDSAPTSGSAASNVPAAELASNFNNVVKSIYSVTRENSNSKDPTIPQGLFISKESIERARTYYIDRMAKIKNDQAGSIHAMIIPLKSSITMDGMAGLYPFQLYTIDEKILPYRYNSYNLNNKRVAFSIARMTHTISNNEWTTSLEGFMTLLRNPTDDQNNVKEVTPTTTNLADKNLAFGNTGCSRTGNYKFEYTSVSGYDAISFSEVKRYLSEKKYSSNIIQSVFSIMYQEARYNDTSFKSIGSPSHNYAGIQTDGGEWKYGDGRITGQTCVPENGTGKYRAFAIFKDSSSFLDFMALTVKDKGFDTQLSNTEWAIKYLENWVGNQNPDASIISNKSNIYKNSIAAFANIK